MFLKNLGLLAVATILLQSSSCGGGSKATGADDAGAEPMADSSAEANVDAGAGADGNTGVDAADEASCASPPKDSGDCTARLAPGADRKCTIQVSGQAREVLLYAPANYDACHPAALVVDAHGAQETDAEQAGLQPFYDWPNGLGSGWRLVADREGFVVAQPQGIGNDWQQSSDIDFMLQIPAWVSGVASIDPKRVYMTGISDGGGLTYATGCRDTATFHGFAPVSGFSNSSACPLTHPAPIIHFHSPDDKLVPFADGQAALQMWVGGVHCQRGPTPSAQFGGPNTDPRPVCVKNVSGSQWALGPCDPSAPVTTCQMWDQCDGGVAATFCTVAPDMVHHYDVTGGHILYINATNLSLAAVAWEYFKMF